MEKVRICSSVEYDVEIGEGLLGRVGEAAAGAAPKGRIAVVVTDETVEKLYFSRVRDVLSDASLKVCLFSIKPGEKSKSLGAYMSLLSFMAVSGVTRSDLVVALGGGVVGDLAGFAAATFMRGVGFMQVPTTILAAVDSSVGGKTAVDTDFGKNMVGAFYQPRAVVCDSGTFATLPGEEITSGLCECIKCSVLSDRGLMDTFVSGDFKNDIDRVVARCVEIKGEFVNKDERDRGVRQMLNLGHTPAHAIEKLSGYTIPHGMAVGIGLGMMCRAAAKRGYMSQSDADLVGSALSKIGAQLDPPFGANEMAEAAVYDKKRSGSRITVVMPREIGRCELVEMGMDEIRGLFEDGLSL